MKKLLLITISFILLIASSNAQLFYYCKEYRINADGKYLTYYTPPPAANTVNIDGSTYINPITGKKTTIKPQTNTSDNPNPEKGINEIAIDPSIKDVKNQSPNPLIFDNSNTRNILNIPDSLILEYAYQGGSQFEIDKQIWIIERHIGNFYNNITGEGDGFYTFKNKASGKLLTRRRIGETVRIELKSLINYPSEDQKWEFENIEEYETHQRPFYGKTRELAIKHKGTSYCIFREGDAKTNSSTFKLRGRGPSILYDSDVEKDRTDFNFYISPNEGVPVTLTNITTPLCPSALIAGDRDFNKLYDPFDRGLHDLGYTPEIRYPEARFRIDLFISNDRKEIWARIIYHLKELKNDRSETSATWDLKLYTAPNGRLLERIISDPHYERYPVGNQVEHNYRGYIDNNGEFLDYCEIITDTLGDDIAYENNCEDCSRINRIMFRPLWVLFQN